MIRVIVFFVFLSSVFASRASFFKYNTQYSISKPHYLHIFGPTYQVPSMKTADRIASIPYEIPKYVSKKIFSQNLLSNKKSSH